MSDAEQMLGVIESRLQAEKDLNVSIIHQLHEGLLTHPQKKAPFRIQLTLTQLQLMILALSSVNSKPTHIYVGAFAWQSLCAMIDAPQALLCDKLTVEVVTGNMGKLFGIPVISDLFLRKETEHFRLDQRLLAFIQVDSTNGHISDFVAANL